MKDQQLDVVRGSGNVYRDLGQDNADVKMKVEPATYRARPIAV